MDELFKKKKKEKKKLQSKLIEEYFMFKVLVWFAMGKFLVLKIFSIKMHCGANRMAQLDSLYN